MTEDGTGTRAPGRPQPRAAEGSSTGRGSWYPRGEVCVESNGRTRLIPAEFLALFLGNRPRRPRQERRRAGVAHAVCLIRGRGRGHICAVSPATCLPPPPAGPALHPHPGESSALDESPPLGLESALLSGPGGRVGCTFVQGPPGPWRQQPGCPAGASFLSAGARGAAPSLRGPLPSSFTPAGLPAGSLLLGKSLHQDMHVCTTGIPSLNKSTWPR